MSAEESVLFTLHGVSSFTKSTTESGKIVFSFTDVMSVPCDKDGLIEVK